MNILIVVDIQKDFYSGKLAVLSTPGERTAFANNIWKLLDTEKYDLIVATQDWHPWNHCSFERNGGKWPTHCVQDSTGAELCDFITQYPHVIVRKGMDKDTEEYSGLTTPLLAMLFYLGEANDLETYLSGSNEMEITVIGLATDYCVRATAIDLKLHMSSAIPITVLLDCCAGVEEESTMQAIQDMKDAGVIVK